MEEKIYDNCDVLIIDEKDRPALTVSEAEKFKPIIKDFMETYTAHPDEDVQTWLTPKLASYLPEKSEKEISQISTDIVKSINIAEEKKSALVKAKSEGVSSKGWFVKECQKAVSGMASAEAANYMQTLDNAVTQANESMIRTVTTQSGMVSQSPVLDGYIAELASEYPSLLVFLTGGDAESFDIKAKSSTFAVPDLVLLGLARITQHNE